MPEIQLERIGYFKAPYHSNIRPNMISPGYEYIELLADGEVYFDSGNGKKPHGCGYIFWHIPGDYTVHDNNAGFPYQCLCVLFKTGNNGKDRHVPRCSFWDDETELKSFSDTMLKAFHGGSCDIGLLGNYAFYRLKWEALRRQDENSRKNEYPLPLKKAIEYMDSNFMENISVEEIAGYAGISVSHLFLLFRKHLKESPHSYLNSLRIAEAKQMLVKSSENIKEISYKCSFQNLESFYRFFKRRTGVSPGEYRRKFSTENYFSL
ncbi:MAG: hypothetical protein A2017_01775 [Lentisphaerae bacterium GWF2_44_16]|nr:MAG: hypothetical protein A2017_01775 [Lentisphaerae bacterium GWF2_44_16]